MMIMILLYVLKIDTYIDHDTFQMPNYNPMIYNW